MLNSSLQAEEREEKPEPMDPVISFLSKAIRLTHLVRDQDLGGQQSCIMIEKGLSALLWAYAPKTEGNPAQGSDLTLGDRAALAQGHADTKVLAFIRPLPDEKSAPRKPPKPRKGFEQVRARQEAILTLWNETSKGAGQIAKELLRTFGAQMTRDYVYGVIQGARERKDPRAQPPHRKTAQESGRIPPKVTNQ